MINQWLSSEFQDLFTKNPSLRVVLWFDAKGEYARLLEETIFPPQNTSFMLLGDAQQLTLHVFTSNEIKTDAIMKQ